MVNKRGYLNRWLTFSDFQLKPNLFIHHNVNFHYYLFPKTSLKKRKKENNLFNFNLCSGGFKTACHVLPGTARVIPLKRDWKSGREQTVHTEVYWWLWPVLKHFLPVKGLQRISNMTVCTRMLYFLLEFWLCMVSLQGQRKSMEYNNLHACNYCFTIKILCSRLVWMLWIIVCTHKWFI